MIQIERSSGRLVEITFSGSITRSEIERFDLDMRDVIEHVAKVVFLVDFSSMKVMGSEESDVMTQVMRRDNHRVVRSAYLLPDAGAAAQMQTARMIREAANPDRRAFRTGPELLAWLEPVLDPAERAAAARFAMRTSPATAATEAPPQPVSH